MFRWVLWHIKYCRLFNAKSSLYIYIKYLWFGWVGFYGISTLNPVFTWILMWELIFIFCGLFVLILVVFFMFFLLSLRFDQISPLAFFRWFYRDLLSLVTVFPVITAFHSCYLSHHVFDQVNLWPAWVGFETAIFWQCSPGTLETQRLYPLRHVAQLVSKWFQLKTIMNTKRCNWTFDAGSWCWSSRRGAAGRSMRVADVGRVVEVQLDVRCG